MVRRVSDIGEFDLIGLLLKTLGPQPVEVGLGTQVILDAGDDCAAITPAPGVTLLHTTDTMVEGIHFLHTMPPEDLGWKSLASNLSDIAAMGGLPTVGLITLAVPPSLELEWLLGWYRGMATCARKYGTALVGGDIVRTHSDVCITVTLSGEVEPSRLLTRAGARPGDRLIVTGSPGDSAAGLALILAGREPPASLVRAHLRPEPRVAEARAAIATGGVHAMMDLSDGPGGDLRHICCASGVGARIEEASLPLGQDLLNAARALGRDPLDFALSGGEDYELLLCVRPDSADRVLHAIAIVGETTATIIGEIVPAEEGILLIPRSGQPRPLPGSFTHF